MRNLEYMTAIEREGVELLETSHRGSGHVGYLVRYRGHEKVFIGPHSASCRRSVLNFRAELRRWKKARS